MHESKPSHQPQAPEPASVYHEVREHGDVLDRLEWLKRTRGTGMIGLMGAGVAGFQMGVSAGSYMLSSAAALATADASRRLVTDRVFRYRQKKEVSSLLEGFDDISSQLEGGCAELYRQNTPDGHHLHLFLESPEEDYSHDEVTSLLTKTLHLSEENDIASVTIPRSSLSELAHQPAEDAVTTRNEWLQRIKPHTVADGKTNDEVYTFTRRELAEFLEVNKPPADDALATYIDALASINPKHPFIKTHRTHQSNNAQGLKKMAQKFKRHIDLKLFDVEPHKIRLDNGAYIRTKRDIVGKATIGKDDRPHRIVWKAVDGRPTGDRDSLLSYIGTDQEHLEQLPQKLRTLPKHKAIELCEVGAWLAAEEALGLDDSGNTRTVSNSQIAVDGHVKTNVDGMQKRTAEQVLGRRRPFAKRSELSMTTRPGRYRRLGRSALRLGLVTLTGVGAGIGFVEADKQLYNKHLKPLYDAYLSENATNAQKAEIDDEIDKVSDSLLLRITGEPLEISGNINYALQERVQKLVGQKDFRDLAEELPESVKKLAKRQYIEDQRSTVGNVGSVDNNPVWLIKTFGNMDSEGYWTETTSNELREDLLEWFDRGLNTDQNELYDTIARRRGFEPNEESERTFELYDEITASYDDLPFLPHPNTLDTDQPHLKVSRTMSLRQLSPDGLDMFYGPTGLIKNDTVRFVPIPVLQETRPVAGLVNGGVPSRVIELKNGTFVLAVNAFPSMDRQPLNIEYWLEPADDERPVAVGPISEALSQSEPLKPLMDEWEQVIPNIKALSPADRLALQTRHISSQFTYRLNPLDGHRALESAQLFATSALKKQQANCNVANTLLAISNPRQLNYALGFRNSNTREAEMKNEAFLSGGESHAWTIDKEGAIHDATPGGATFEEAQQFLEPSLKEKNDTIRTAIPFIAIAALGLAAYRSRRRVHKIISRIGKDTASIALASLDDRDKAITYQVINEALYSDKKMNADRYQAAKNRAATEDTSVEANWRHFARIHDPKHTASRIKTRSIDYKEAKKAVRVSKAIHRLYRLSERG